MAAMFCISDWLTQFCLTLNIRKNACMYFSTWRKDVYQPEIFVKCEKLQIISDFMYFGVIINSHLTFGKQVKGVTGKVKLNLSNFKFIRNQLVRGRKKHLKAYVQFIQKNTQNIGLAYEVTSLSYNYEVQPLNFDLLHYGQITSVKQEQLPEALV